MAKQRAISVRRARHRTTGCLYSYGPFADGTLQSDFPTYLSDSPKACLSISNTAAILSSTLIWRTPMLPAPNNRYQSAPVCIQGILLYPNHPKRCVLHWELSTYGHIERNSLTGTVRPQQSHNFSLLYVDRDMADYCTLSVLLHQILCPEHHLLSSSITLCHHNYIYRLLSVLNTAVSPPDYNRLHPGFSKNTVPFGVICGETGANVAKIS